MFGFQLGNEDGADAGGVPVRPCGCSVSSLGRLFGRAGVHVCQQVRRVFEGGDEGIPAVLGFLVAFHAEAGDVFVVAVAAIGLDADFADEWFPVTQPGELVVQEAWFLVVR